MSLTQTLAQTLKVSFIDLGENFVFFSPINILLYFMVAFIIKQFLSEMSRRNSYVNFRIQIYAEKTV